MTAPVDVLAVLRRHAIAERERLGATDNDAQEALAVVAELLEASELVLAANAVDVNFRERVAARSRLRAALARCQTTEIPTELNVDTAAPVAPGVTK